jgi:hypothetical protein
MKFYFVKNSNQEKAVILSTRVTAGTLPDQIQEETEIPQDFFITLPVGVLTKPLDNEYNEDLRRRRIKAYDNNLVSIYRSKRGNRIPTNPAEFQTAFANMYDLRRLEKNQTDDFKIDINLDEYKPEPGVEEPIIPGLDEGWERVTVQRWLPDGATFETIQEAAIERELEDEVYVAYATSMLKPAILYVASSLEQVEQMFAKTQNPNSLLCGYVNWTWYITSHISKTLQVVLDTLEIENLSTSLKIYSVDEKPVINVTFGQPVVDEVFKFLRENVDKDIERRIAEIIGSYADTTRAGVCDVVLTNTEPTYQNLNNYEMNTDAAYIRTGFCGIAWMKESPAGKLISDKSIEELAEDEIDAGAANVRDITRHLRAQIIPDIGASYQTLYILSEHELHFVSNRAKRVGVDENILVTNNPSQITKVWDFFHKSPDTIRDPTSTILLNGIQGILEITGHDCKITPKLFYVNRSQEEIYSLNVVPTLLAEFQTKVQAELSFPGSRILFFDELRWLISRGFHTKAHLVSEAEIKVQEEEKKSAEAAAQPRSTQDIQKALDTAVKKLQANVTLNRYDRFAALLKDFKHDERPLIIASISEKMKSDTTHSRRLNLFYKQFNSIVLADQALGNVSNLRKK